VAIAFEDRGEETEITLTHEGFGADGLRDSHSDGWTSIFDRMAAAF
jgi:hypothetical protein